MKKAGRKNKQKKQAEKTSRKNKQKKQAEKTGDNKNRISGGINGGISGGINGGLNEELACKIIGVINDNNYISVLAISEKLNIPKRTVERKMKKLCDLGRIVRQGSKKKVIGKCIRKREEHLRWQRE